MAEAKADIHLTVTFSTEKTKKGLLMVPDPQYVNACKALAKWAEKYKSVIKSVEVTE